MTKDQLRKYRRRRTRILRMIVNHTQAEIARKLGMKPQRVNQILAKAEMRQKDFDLRAKDH